MEGWGPWFQSDFRNVASTPQGSMKKFPVLSRQSHLQSQRSTDNGVQTEGQGLHCQAGVLGRFAAQQEWAIFFSPVWSICLPKAVPGGA